MQDIRAVDFINKYIEDNGLSQTQAAQIAGMSRQNFWDKINNRNPKFRTMTHIIDSFGFELHVITADGKPVEVSKETAVLEIGTKRNLPYDTVEDILKAVGFKFNIIPKK